MALERDPRTTLRSTPDFFTLTSLILSVWGQLIIFFPIFIFYAYFGMLLKGMGESFILSKDEPLTPNIDGVVAL